MANISLQNLAALAASSLLALACAAQPNLLPLEGGSNFRDMGGYPAADGRLVKANSLFRSGAMTSLTQNDMQLLDEIGIQTVVDLRSSEELELFPNHWATQSGLDYLNHNYSLVSSFEQLARSGVSAENMMPVFYQQMPEMLVPQLQMLFDEMLAGEGPLVLNCSAGQDRTGLASSLILAALGVPRNIITEDYLASTRLRNTLNEKGDIDLKAAAQTNAFAALMVAYSDGEDYAEPQPLLTDDLRPFLSYSFEYIEATYGSVFGYLEEKLGVDQADIERLRELYLTRG